MMGTLWLVIPRARNATSNTAHTVAPINMTRLGPNSDDSTPDSHEPIATNTPYNRMMLFASRSEYLKSSTKYVTR